MSHPFWGGFATYMGNFTSNKTMVQFNQGKKILSKKAVISRKVASTATSTKVVYQIRSCNESDRLLTTFGPAENTRDEIKEKEH